MKNHVLIIEDDEMVQAFVALHLEHEGYVVSKASTGGGGLDILAGDEIDLVLLDLNLPDGDGLDIARQIKQLSSIPIIILTARVRSDDKFLGLGLGVDEFLIKPVEPGELSLRVGRLLGRHGAAAGSPKAARPQDVPVLKTGSGPGNGKPEKSNILVADDDELLVKLIEFKLNQAGYAVIGVGDGGRALQVALENKPDLIVLDRMMPGLDGIEVLRRLKENPETRNIFVVILSARGMECDIVSALELGADEYMVKPFMPGELTTRINRLLDGARQP